jgi:hypothetical protein
MNVAGCFTANVFKDYTPTIGGGGVCDTGLNGNCVLSIENFEQVIVVPNGAQAFGLQTGFERGLALEEEKSPVLKKGQVLGGESSAGAVKVFAKGDIERPM